MPSTTQPYDFNTASGVAPVCISAATLAPNEFMIIASAKAAGLKIFWPNPPNSILPNKIAIAVAIIIA